MASETSARATFTVLAVIAIVLTLLTARPFAVGLFLAAVLASALYPLHARFTQALRGHGKVSATVITLGVLLAGIMPLAALTAVLVREVVQGVKWLREALRSGGVEGLIGYLPDPMERHAQRLLDELPTMGEQLQGVSGQALPAVKTVGGVLTATGSVALQVTMLLIALFFLLTDGKRLVAWLDAVVPLKRGQLLELLGDFRRVTRAVLVSTFATAGVQAMVAGIGYFIAKVPQALFFAIVTFIFALIPAVGAAIVVLALAGLKIATGHVGSGIFLAVWGIAVVGVVDNVVKPYLIRGDIEIHGAVVFFALLGGLAAFGTVGLIVGPLIVAFLVAVTRIYWRDFGQRS